jgi:hypothetical protein
MAASVGAKTYDQGRIANVGSPNIPSRPGQLHGALASPLLISPGSSASLSE